MAKFVYRLQKIYELRERRVKEQEQRVLEARRRVQTVELHIEEKKNEIQLLRQNMLTAHHTLMGTHDIFIHSCNEQLDQLYIDLEVAKQKLLEEARRLVQYQAELEALEKHKEKARELWEAEEKYLEMKQLDEVAIQRYFRAKQAQLEEAEEDAQAEAEQEAEDTLNNPETAPQTP